ncbi:unnamed protein product [Hapterophycus canaliculatus]
MAREERKRRQRRCVVLDQVDIPASSLDVIEDEVLGLGGFGTVYLADLGGGLNAAAKVVQFRPLRDDGAGDGNSSSGGSTTCNSNENGDRDDDEEDHSNNNNTTTSNNNGQHRGPTRPQSTPRSPQQQAGEGNIGRRRDTPPVDQKARRRAVVAKARRAAAEARTEGRQRLAFCQELEAMKRLRNPNTVHIYGAVTTLGRDRLVLVMEFLPGGDLLLKLSKAKRPLDDKVLRQIARDVCSGMAFLHQEAFVHGDLKSANVLFDARGRAKVLCREMATSMSDVYSFGVVLWECLCRKVPWAHVTDVGVLSMAVVSGERPPLPENAPEDLADLARLCWSGDPTARPTLESVLSNYL